MNRLINAFCIATDDAHYSLYLFKTYPERLVVPAGWVLSIAHAQSVDDGLWLVASTGFVYTHTHTWKKGLQNTLSSEISQFKGYVASG
jgi:hypothetical protein